MPGATTEPSRFKWPSQNWATDMCGEVQSEAMEVINLGADLEARFETVKSSLEREEHQSLDDDEVVAALMERYEENP